MNVADVVVNFPEIYYEEEISGRNFQKFYLAVNITDNLGTSVDLNETVHAAHMSTGSHENNVLMLILVHY